MTDHEQTHQPADEQSRDSGVDAQDTAAVDGALFAEGDYAEFSDSRLRSALESMLLVIDTPVTVDALATVLDTSSSRVRTALEDYAAELISRDSGIHLREAAGGWRLYTNPVNASYVEALLTSGVRATLTRAALETLAVIAYKQPATRSAIAAIRGVNVDGVVRTLLARGLIAEAGQAEDSTAHTYVTTELFLERLGLSSLEELPELAPLLPDLDVIDAIAEELPGLVDRSAQSGH